MSTIKRRAVRDDQKLERRQVLIDTAWTLFQAQPYEQINIIDVATAASLAKGTVYLYFKTKEALFLEVLIDQFTKWFDRVDEALPTTPPTIEGVAALLTDSLAENPHLTRLFAIVHVVLERNIDYDDALHFKQFVYERIGKTGTTLEGKLAFLSSGEGAQLLLRAYALVIGVQHIADPAPIVREVIEQEAKLNAFLVDFKTEFSIVLTALFCGLSQ
jgi:AcrR family transcriptional regulator